MATRFDSDIESMPLLDEKPKTEHHRSIGLVSLVFLIYFSVSGGPLGSEEVITAGGPFLGIAAVLVFPWLYSLPIAIMSADLSCQFPNDGGYTIWVANAFGEFWAFQEGYWSWLGGVIDNSMYPVMVSELLSNEIVSVFKGAPIWWIKPVLSVVLSFAMSLPNIFGVQLVGKVLVVLGVLVLLPYAAFVGVGLFSIVAGHATPLNHARNTPLDPLHLLNVVFWNFSGWDSASTFAGEVKNPRKAFPLALVASVLFVTLSYLVPLLVAIANNVPGTRFDEWEEGTFVEVANHIGGSVLRLGVVFSGLCGSFAMHTTEMFVDSFLLLGMAEQRLIPKFFAYRHPRLDTPLHGIFASIAVMVVTSTLFSWDSLLWVNNFFAGLSLCLEIVAALWLNKSQPQRSTSNDNPVEHVIQKLGRDGYSAMLLLPLFVVVVLVCATAFAHSWVVPVVCASLTLVGAAGYYLPHRREGRAGDDC